MNGKITWFVEPSTPQDNNIIGRNISEENAHPGILCADGERRDLWECPNFRFVSAARTIADVRVWRRKGGGRIEETPFFNSPVHTGAR